MIKEAAISYFREMGALLKSEPDRSEKARYLAAVKTTPDFRDAFTTLRELTKSARAARETQQEVEQQSGCDNCPNQLPHPMTLPELIDFQFGKGKIVPKILLGTTPWGADYYEFTIESEQFPRHMIVPIRLSKNEEDHIKAQEIVVRRCFQVGTMSTNHYPHIPE